MQSKQCMFEECSKKIRSNRTSGLCDTYSFHKHSLFLELFYDKGQIINAPLHTEIVEKLIDWAKPRN